MAFHVDSEVGVLQQVIVHRPLLAFDEVEVIFPYTQGNDVHGARSAVATISASWLLIALLRWKAMLKTLLAATAVALSFHGAFAATKWGADYFPDIVLTTQDGAKVRFYEDLVKGKNVAVNVVYTSCRDECPLETARMAEVQRLLGDRMGKDIFFLSISIDPEKDTPQVLKAYTGKFGVGPGWLFLTGKKDDIKALTRKLGLSRTSDAFSKDGHASSLMLGNDANGQWMRNSAVDNPRFLAATMAGFFGWKDVQPTQSYAQARPLDIGRAQFTFESRCASCHTASGRT